VAVDPAISCMKCEFCLRGHPNLCPEVRFAGHGDVDGALREVLAWNEKYLIPIPDSLTYADGAMLLDVSSLVSHRFPLAQAAEAFAAAERREGLKVIVEC
jgi:threonine dehydrogenase-like Zn-dependent dehydrogenase